MLKIVIASRNDGKIREIKGYSKQANKKIEWITYQDVRGFPTVEEDGDTFFENAGLKAKAIAHHTRMMVVADDSGLEVDALDGRPGIYSSRFAGIKATDEENRRKLLECLEGVSEEDRGAQFVCSLVLWDPNKGLIFDARGICRGKIGLTEKGEGGFGYDCLFIPEGYHKTMAELSADQKNRISHRGRALTSFYRFIENF